MYLERPRKHSLKGDLEIRSSSLKRWRAAIDARDGREESHRVEPRSVSAENTRMKTNRVALALLFILVLFSTVAVIAGESEASNDQAVLVEPKNVCMINNRSMANEQIPVEIDGKTYYGCCAMCKERLEKDETSRYAIDPVSGKKVDKSKAVIGALPGAAVLYFENETNLKKYNAGERAKK